jgi:hypothetical protein
MGVPWQPTIWTVAKACKLLARGGELNYDETHNHCAIFALHIGQSDQIARYVRFGAKNSTVVIHFIRLGLQREGHAYRSKLFDSPPRLLLLQLFGNRKRSSVHGIEEEKLGEGRKRRRRRRKRSCLICDRKLILRFQTNEARRGGGV